MGCILSRRHHQMDNKSGPDGGINRERTSPDTNRDASYEEVKPTTTEETAAEPFNNNSRWSEKLKVLAQMDKEEVFRVGNIIYVHARVFRIAQGSNGAEVFLGLRDDGAKVAIKRTTKLNSQGLENEKALLQLPKMAHQSIVRYYDYVEDKYFGYLVLQLCEYTLGELIKHKEEGGLQKKKLIHEVLEGLSVLHQDPPILHLDLQPQNILVGHPRKRDLDLNGSSTWLNKDVTGKAKLAGFDISTLLVEGQTTRYTKAAGTKCWESREAIMAKADVPKKCSTDIQVAGMLIYYILSGGHHPFGDEDYECEYNIVKGIYTLDHVQDVVAKDLIEWMINKEPKDRPTVEECLSHPFFWSPKKRIRYLKEIGNLSCIEGYNKAENAKKRWRKELKSWVDECTENGSFKDWKSQFPPELVRIMGKRRNYEDHIVDLLRFIRNAIEHHQIKVARPDQIPNFSAVFICVLKYARQAKWNSESALEEMFKKEEDLEDDKPSTDAVSSSNSDDHVKVSVEESRVTFTKPIQAQHEK